jgi:methionine aminotransferase
LKDPGFRTRILVTAGATQVTAIQNVVNSNDEVIILNLAMTSVLVLLCNATPIRVPLNDDYTIGGVCRKCCSGDKTR